MTHKHTHSPAAASGHEHAPAHAHACGKSACEAASSPSSPADPLPADKGALRFRIPTMDCAVEESEIRRALEPIAGVSALRFDLSQRVLSLKAEAPPVLEAALAAIRKAGFEPTPLDAAANASSEDGPAPIASGLPRLLASLLFALLAEVFAFFAPDTRPFQLGAMALAAIAIGLAGFDTYKKGFYALRVGRLNINALMAVAVTGAFLIGQWPEAAMVMALYAIAELIEARAVDKARNAIKTLLAMAPEEAEVLQADGSWLRQLTGSVAVGATVRLRPGERVPLDGVITQGASAIDQAPVTGESVPVDKAVGDEVYAGTINQTAALEFRVSALASNSTLARIIHAVEEAQSARAPTQRFVDKFAAIYTPAVFVLALAVAAFMPWLMGWTWLEAVYKALVLLVIACPCALVISTPVTIVSGLAAAARRGILIKGGV
ncbi:MAG: heavy metal translocating P-type ATPase, partial [Burkholderiaceae bacterium]|nr:heavy metal translocating P-type ATPase [Burkholderiaceae bacterium]